MTDLHVSLPPALRRALDLLADPPANPDVSKGYLDLLGDRIARRCPEEHRPDPGGVGITDRVDALRQRPSPLAPAAQRVATSRRVAEHSAGRDRAGCRLRSGQRHRVAGPRRRARTDWPWASTSPRRC